MAHAVTLIPGDGTGPELTAVARDVLDASGAELAWSTQVVGVTAFEQTGEALPPAVLDAVRATGVALKGPVATPSGAPFRSVNVALRRSLDLFAQVRPCRSFDGVWTPFGRLDVLVMRETKEDLYAGIEVAAGSPEAAELIAWLERTGHDAVPPGAGFSLKPTSEEGARRFFRFAFDYAVAHGRRRITIAHKATVMRETDGIFVGVGMELAAEYPDVVCDALAVDTLALQLVRRPAVFDVIVGPNLYGDILSDLVSGLAGGIGLASGANYGSSIAVFEAAHGTAPAQAGKDTANPLALVLSGALLLRHIGEVAAAERVEWAVAEVLARGTHLTYDLRAPDDRRAIARTSEMRDALLAAIGETVGA